MNQASKDKPRRLSYYFVQNETTRRFYETTAAGLGLVNSFFIISYLSVFHFGLYQLMLSLIALLESFGAGFFNDVVVVELRRLLNAGKAAWVKKLFWENVLFRLVLALVLVAAVFLGAGLIGRFYGDDVALLLKIASVLLIIHTVRLTESTLLKPAMVFSYWAYPAVMEFVKLLLITGLVIWTHLTIVNIVAAHVVAEVVALAALTAGSFVGTYRRLFGSVTAWTGRLLWGVLRTHGGWVFVRYGFSKATKNTTPWFIKFFINTEAVAFYSLAVNLVSMVEKVMPLYGFGDVLLLKVDKKAEMAFVFKRTAKYLIWMGTVVGWGALIIVPPAISFIFPKYTPAIGVFVIMLLALPVYGLYKVLKSTLSVLREYKVLAMRLANEVLIFPIGSVVFLPLLGLSGAGMVYVIAYLERCWFFYSQLIKKFPEFRIKATSLIRFDNDDRDLIRKAWRQFMLSFRSFFLRI